MNSDKLRIDLKKKKNYYEFLISDNISSIGVAYLSLIIVAPISWRSLNALLLKRLDDFLVAKNTWVDYATWLIFLERARY